MRPLHKPSKKVKGKKRPAPPTFSFYFFTFYFLQLVAREKTVESTRGIHLQERPLKSRFDDSKNPCRKSESAIPLLQPVRRACRRPNVLLLPGSRRRRTWRRVQSL